MRLLAYPRLFIAVAIARQAMRMGDEAPVFAFLQSTQPEVEAVVRSVLTGSRALGETAHASLGPECLPPRIARLAEGLIYGVACGEQAVRLPLLAAALVASLRSGKRCALLTPCDPGMFLRKARLARLGLEGWMKGGELAIFQFARDAAKHLFRAGTERLLAELEHNIPSRDAFLVIDQADALFMLSDPRAAAEAAQRYAEWASSRGHAVLAAFAPAANAPRDYVTLRRIADNFGGFALARTSHGASVFEIRHWFAAEGASSCEAFELRFHGAR